MKVVDTQAKNWSTDRLLNHQILTCIVGIKIVLINVIYLGHSGILQRTVGHICDLENVGALFVGRDVCSVEEIAKCVFCCFEGSYGIAGLIDEIEIVIVFGVYI